MATIFDTPKSWDQSKVSIKCFERTLENSEFPNGLPSDITQ